MRIFKRTGKPGRTGSARDGYYLDYYHAGQRYRVKAGSSERAAERLRLRVETEINAGTHDPDKLRNEVHGARQTELTFGELVKAFLAAYRSRGGSDYYKWRAVSWLAFFGGDKPVSAIKPADVAAFRVHREKLEWGASTVRKDLISLQTLFRWASRSDPPLAEFNPAMPSPVVRRPGEPAGRERFLTREEQAALVAGLDPDLARLISWLAESGMRLGEAAKLKWVDLDTKTGWIYVAPGKTGKARRIPYDTTLRAIAGAVPRVLVSPYVFNEKDATGFRAIAANTASKRIASAMRAAMLSDATAHTLRHTFASRLAAAGVPMKAIAELLGQNVATTTARYMHLQPETLRQALEVLHQNRTA